LVEDATTELKNLLSKPTKFYIGFDPTSDSLHLGNLVGIIVLSWFEKFGHKPYVLIGGATGRIGDPSGKNVERPLLKDEEITINVERITQFFQKLFPNGNIKIINNDEWFRSMTLIDFLRDVGKPFRLGPMLSKESVKVRLNSEEGISFTEFSYQVLQAYDFYHLFKQENVCLQLGGSDQWGNIIAGIDLIRKQEKAPVYGMTFPLLVDSEGKKFGKTEKGAVWLSDRKFSPYDFYQYLYRVADADVIQLMKMLTFMDLSEIESIEKSMKESSYVANSAQKILAERLTTFIHGKEGVQLAQKVTSGVFSHRGDTTLDGSVLKQIAKDMPHSTHKLEEVLGKKFTEIAALSGLTSSKSEALRLLKNGGAYVNNQKIQDINYCISNKDFIEGKYLLLGVGKRKKHLIQLKD